MKESERSGTWTCTWTEPPAFSHHLFTCSFSHHLLPYHNHQPRISILLLPSSHSHPIYKAPSNDNFYSSFHQLLAGGRSSEEHKFVREFAEPRQIACFIISRKFRFVLMLNSSLIILYDFTPEYLDVPVMLTCGRGVILCYYI